MLINVLQVGKYSVEHWLRHTDGGVFSINSRIVLAS